ncbi:class I SAM-dependent methyltransferase [Hyphomicrobium sp.]|uniref:SAM-dependent methyltransferase n=1 Tax=Hyphomicrobium sp. TaxID=82 RepID=UPI0025C4D3D3|nr:class I SAM-dependent methyltransferase [Hyphomicrobium sp.]MCC7250522.1 class I SAM-dependent methyltransferase [Hyphomicrobium sp.]
MPQLTHSQAFRFVLVAVALAAAMSRGAFARDLDVPYVPTPQVVVDKMLEMAEIKSDDVLIDLGSGDGRIPITAAKKYGITASGVDLNPVRVKEAKANAEKEGVTDKVEFHEQDLFQTDLTKATVITMYLLTEVNMKLRPKLMKLKPGTRIVSHAFLMGDWTPDKTATVDGRDVYMWVVRENMIRETSVRNPAD